MRVAKIIYFLFGLALLAVVVAEVDFAEVTAVIGRIGLGELAIVLGIYFVAFAFDSTSWHLTLLGQPMTLSWAYRIWKLRMIGELFNTVIPASGLGGEPVKAELLKSEYGVGYREGLAALILSMTIMVLSLLPFLGIGLVLMFADNTLSATYQTIAALGLAVFSVAIILFYAVQRFRIVSFAGTRLAKFRFAAKLESMLHHLNDIDDRLIAFYSGHTGRFLGAILLAFLSWVLGALEIYAVLAFLGHPLSFAEAWIIEAAAQMVRNGAFFIPAGIGAQEGAFLVVCTAMTGTPALGLAVAVLRRIREIIWLIWGGYLSLFMVRRRPGADGGA